MQVLEGIKCSFHAHPIDTHPHRHFSHYIDFQERRKETSRFQKEGGRAEEEERIEKKEGEEKKREERGRGEKSEHIFELNHSP